MRALLGRLRRQRGSEPPAYVDDGSLAVLVRAPDPAEADSAVLARAAAEGVDLTCPLLLRHHLLLPDPGAAVTAATLLAQDGYALSVEPGPAGSQVRARASRTQLLTALSASQERSRAAGLAQRLGGDVRGWDALGPHPEGGAADPCATGARDGGA